jgi:hypothetical protein
MFVKGQDLYQFEESYGTTRIEQINEMTGQLKDLMRYGASTREGLDALLSLDGLTDRHRAQATAGTRMDVTLEASLKAYLDRMYLGFNQKDITSQFFNPGPLGDLVKSLRSTAPDLEAAKAAAGSVHPIGHMGEQITTEV